MARAQLDYNRLRRDWKIGIGKNKEPFFFFLRSLAVNERRKAKYQKKK